MTTIQIYNDDCFKIFPKIKEKIDMVLVDLPYAQTACSWDCLIDLKKMWEELKKICKRECVYVFFCTTKFGYKLIQSNEKWFRYDLVWEKSRRVGFLSANKMPLRQHEMIYVFSDTNNDDLDNSRNLGLRTYFKNVMEYIDKPKNELIKKIGQGLDHSLRVNSTQFSLPTEQTYNKLIEVYEIDKMDGFRTLDDLKNEWGEPTYNPQKTAGKPYKTTGRGEVVVYGSKRIDNENKGDRHPTSILKIPETPENQQPREHEMIYVFSDTNSDDLDNSRNLGLRAYFKNVMEYIDKPKNELIKKIGQGLDHSLRVNSTQFSLPTEQTYNKLIEVYEIDKMDGFRTLDDLKNEWGEPTYNPQKTEGKPYKTKGREDVGVYSEKGYKGEPIENKGDRHPTTIVKFNNPAKSLHRTQKPVDLCEWLIKTYSNENDLILDFTMGSGTTGEACKNTKRRFIGIEKDEEIFKIANERLKEYYKNNKEQIKEYHREYYDNNKIN